METGKRYASFDGDADRLVYYYKDCTGTFRLLDGDKIATLFAHFLQPLIKATELDLTMRVVQTAYANGSSTNFIEKTLGIPVVCVPTGVKHLHHEALKYDIGIYFEANGHGTVIFSNDAFRQIKEIGFNSNTSLRQQIAAKKLASVMDLINEQHEGYFGTELVILNRSQMDDTSAGHPLAKLSHHTSERTFGPDRFNVHQTRLHSGSSVESGFEPGTLRP
ncbi:Phosphoacetylglucosamine mutase [Araneus ventricosus]|uniref:Phosphoacetylglucosamine mutase n=1 Tax=Araneus ventricosus TaxID=182803 RepID=A0A4Y2P8E1_ARAVE|nr:Phosphoacetylglucosamine mutase [Araneus ventricosus]